MVGWECQTNPREASGLDPEAVHQLCYSLVGLLNIINMWTLILITKHFEMTLCHTERTSDVMAHDAYELFYLVRLLSDLLFVSDPIESAFGMANEQLSQLKILLIKRRRVSRYRLEDPVCANWNANR
ncbi:hypothetical protein ABNG03_05540 [Halorubrum sp. RMP-47]